MPETPATPQVASIAPVNGKSDANGKVAAAPTTQPAPKIEEPTKEIKVDGKVYKVTEKQLIALAQKGAFADQKLKSVQTLAESSQRIINSLKSPDQFLSLVRSEAKTLGIEPKAYLRELVSKGLVDDDDLDFLAQQTNDRWLPRQKMTAEELEKEKKLARLEQLEKEKQEQELKELTTRQQEQVKQILTAIRGEIIRQVQDDKSFPQTEDNFRLVYAKLKSMNKKGEQVTTESIGKAIGLVKKDLLLHQQNIFDSDKDLPDYGERLIERIGEARAIAISRALIERLKGKQQAPQANEKPKPKEAREKVTDRIDKKLGRTPQGYEILNF